MSEYRYALTFHARTAAEVSRIATLMELYTGGNEPIDHACITDPGQAVWSIEWLMDGLSSYLLECITEMGNLRAESAEDVLIGIRSIRESLDSIEALVRNGMQDKES